MQLFGQLGHNSPFCLLRLVRRTVIHYLVRMSAPSSRWQFPILRAIGRLVNRAWQNWRMRHQDWRNFAIHMLGIPLAVAGLILLFFLPWYWGMAAIILGY